MLDKIKNIFKVFSPYLLIALSYITILTTFKPFGSDDFKAMKYYNYPNLTLSESLKSIWGHWLGWNIRIGELVYYLIGLFPRWVFILFSVTLLFAFLILIFFYLKGSKFKFRKIDSKLLLIAYLFLLSFMPFFGTTFIWMAGVFNHLFNLIIVLIVFIPWRLMLDNVKPNFGKIKFAIYCAISLVAGIATENVVPVMLLAMVIIILKQLVKKEKIYLWQIVSFFLSTLGFLIMFFHQSTVDRIATFESTFWYQTFWERNIHFIGHVILKFGRFGIALIIMLLIIKILMKKKLLKLPEIKKSITMIGFSVISIVIVFFAPYAPIRTTIMFGFFLLVLGCFLIEIILKKYKINNTIISLLVVLVTVSTINLIIDFNNFNKVKTEFLTKQIISGQTKIICPMYDNKVKTFFNSRIVNIDDLLCDQLYFNLLLKNTTYLEFDWRMIDRSEFDNYEF